MMAPDGTIIFEAALSEDVIEEDSTSGLSCDEDVCHRNHTHHGYAPAGDVTSSIVYANYGRPSDFDELEALGVDVAGKVVLTRYGQCFRGLVGQGSPPLRHQSLPCHHATPHRFIASPPPPPTPQPPDHATRKR